MLSAWVFSYKFAANFHITFSEEHLWMAASLRTTALKIYLRYVHY